MKRNRLKLLLWLMIAIISMVTEGMAEESTSKTLSPYFFVDREDSDVDSFPLKKTDVSVQVNGVIADVVIRQSYANEGSTPIHARYIFPASTRAAVQGMTMTIGNKMIVAKIKEKEEAKKDFEQAKKSGKSASLLSQKRPNVFSVSVANIMPDDTVDIELHYTELLIPTDGIYEFVYPTVVGPRYSNQSAEGATEVDNWIENPYLKKGGRAGAEFSIRTDFSTGMPLYGVACTSHQTTIRYENPSIAHVLLDKGETAGGNRDYILRYQLADKKIQSGLMLYQGEDENFFLLTIQPPTQISTRDIPPREYIFLVDVSGSMNGFPLDVSKQLLKNLIGSLRPDDLFNVVLFSGDSQMMSPTSLSATQDNINRAIRVISTQRGGGGTELFAAMKQVLSIPRDSSYSRSVIVVTDGYIGEEKQVCDLIVQNLAQTNVFAFGIGSSVNRYLIEGIAHAGQGEPFVVTRPEEAQAVANRFCDYIKTPLLKDIKIDVQGFDVFELEPAIIPDMFSNRPVVVVGKWKGQAAGSIGISGTSGQGVYHEEFHVADTPSRSENEPLRYLWARTKIARLSDFQFGREKGSNREEITDLGLTYNLLTEYTSFIAVSEEVRNPGGEANDVTQPLPLPQGVSELAIGQSVTNVPEPGLCLMLVLLALVGVVSQKNRLLGLRR